MFRFMVKFFNEEFKENLPIDKEFRGRLNAFLNDPTKKKKRDIENYLHLDAEWLKKFKREEEDDSSEDGGLPEEFEEETVIESLFEEPSEDIPGAHERPYTEENKAMAFNQLCFFVQVCAEKSKPAEVEMAVNNLQFFFTTNRPWVFQKTINGSVLQYIHNCIKDSNPTENEVSRDLYESLNHQTENFPITYQHFLEYPNVRQELNSDNLYFRREGEKTGYVSSYQNHFYLSTICKVFKSGLLLDEVGLSIEGGGSYAAIDRFFFPQGVKEEGGITKKKIFTEFIRLFPKLVHSKIPLEQLANQEYPKFYLQLAELLIYTEGARYLPSIAHVVMWVAINRYEGAFSFSNLPFSLGEVMPILRFLRSKKKFSMIDIEYCYDYSIPTLNEISLNVLSAYLQKECELYLKFYLKCVKGGLEDENLQNLNEFIRSANMSSVGGRINKFQTCIRILLKKEKFLDAPKLHSLDPLMPLLWAWNL